MIMNSLILTDQNGTTLSVDIDVKPFRYNSSKMYVTVIGVGEYELLSSQPINGELAYIFSVEIQGDDLFNT